MAEIRLRRLLHRAQSSRAGSVTRTAAPIFGLIFLSAFIVMALFDVAVLCGWQAAAITLIFSAVMTWISRLSASGREEI